MNKPKELKKGPAWLRNALNERDTFLQGQKPVAGIGTTVVDSPGGRVVNIHHATLPPPDLSNHPFKTVIRNKPDEENKYQAKVALGSNLYGGLGNWSNITIVGLDDWFDVEIDDYIYLAGTYTSGSLTAVEVDSGPSLPGRIVFTSGGTPTQVSWATRISRVLNLEPDAESPVPVVEQNLFFHLTMTVVCVAGNSAEYPFPVS